MQGFEFAAISVPPLDFHNFFEVATGHRRNAGNRAGGHFLSSLFSLLSSLFSLLSSLGPRSRNEAARGPNPGRHGVEKGWPPSGGLIWGPLAASVALSSVFSLLSSLSSLLSSL